MQQERYAVPKSTRLALPNEAVRPGAEPALGTRPDSLNAGGCHAADAQIKPGNAGGDGRSEHLVDHDRSVFAPVLDCEDSAVWQSADRQARPVLDPIEIKIRLPRQLPA